MRRGIPQRTLATRASVVRKANAGQNLSRFQLHRFETVRVQPQRLEDGWRDLKRLHRSGDGARPERGIRDQQYYVGVVMRETSVLGQFLGAAGVGNADIRRNQNVRRARIAIRRQAGWIEKLRDPRSPENLADSRDIRRGRRLTFPACSLRLAVVQLLVSQISEMSSSVGPRPVELAEIRRTECSLASRIVAGEVSRGRWW